MAKVLKDIEKVIRKYLPGVIHLSLATSRGGKPWVSELHFAYDDELNLYFISKADTRHGKEINKNKFVAGNIIKEHGLNEKPRGVYFEGTAGILKSVTGDSVPYKVYAKRFDARKWLLAELGKKGGHKFYKITVKKFYVFDSKESSPSRKYELKWN